MNNGGFGEKKAVFCLAVETWLRGMESEYYFPVLFRTQLFIEHWDLVSLMKSICPMDLHSCTSVQVNRVLDISLNFRGGLVYGNFIFGETSFCLKLLTQYYFPQF